MGVDGMDPLVPHDVAAVLARDCPVSHIAEDGMAVGIRAAYPGRPHRPGDAPSVRVLTLLAPPGREPSASAVTLAVERFDPALAPLDEVVRRVERTTVLRVLRDLGLVGREGHRAQWEVGVAAHLRASGAEPDLARSLAAAEAHMRPHVALVASLFDPVALETCADVERTLDDFGFAGWLHDGAWTSMDGRGGRDAPLLRALRLLPQHADLLVHAARRDPASLGERDPARLLRSAASAAWEGKAVGKALASRAVRAGPTLLGLSMPGAAKRCPDLWDFPSMSATSDGPPRTRATAGLLRLSLLPPSWVPGAEGEDAEAEWEDCLATLQTVSMVLGHMGSVIPYGEAVGRRDGWRSSRGRLLDLLGGRRAGAYHAGRALGDVVEAFMRQVLRPAVCIAEGVEGLRHVPYDEARTILFGSSSVERALERSNEWHARQPRIDHDLANLSPDAPSVAKWGKGFPDADIGDVEVRVLDDGRDLSEEGRKGPNHDGTLGLGHCVGGFADKCATGRSRILSIGRRLPGGGRERLSTVELRQGRDPGRPEVVQHMARGNADPCGTAVATLDAYLDRLASGELTVDAAGLRPVRGSASVVVAAGYDFRRPGLFAAAMAAWRPVLPRAVRDWGPDDFHAAIFPPEPSAGPTP